MNKQLLSLLILLSICAAAPAQTSPNENVHVPASSLVDPMHLGLFAHTNHVLLTASGASRSQNWQHDPLGPTIYGFHPAQIRNAYEDTGLGSGAIAIVDAYGFPTALNDFNVFAGMFGLPKETSTSATSDSNKVFEVVYATGRQPSTDGGWCQEQALDIEWAHAMAPNAKIYLVQAASSSLMDLFAAISKAQKLPGVQQVSMSWGADEFGGEQRFDRYFTNTSVTEFAAAGDVAAVPTYPATSPFVVGVGGTSLALAPASVYRSESAWVNTGGGPSQVYGVPKFQSMVPGLSHRGTPDIAAVADPYTGCAVYDSTKYEGYYGWMVFGGTSLACPVCAGLANAGGANRGLGELSYLYSNAHGFHDIVSGHAGPYFARPGWDFTTGIGTPRSPQGF